MLICTICICQNKQIIPLPTINVDKSHKSIETLQSGAFDKPDNKLNEIWQYLIDNYVPAKTLNNFLNENKSIKNIDNKLYNSLLLQYKKKMGKLHYFNTNNHPSDTNGDLKGNVFYAQSSIIPAGNHIDGDIHPNLVSGRKTLVMFKPHEKTEENANIELKVYNSNDQEIYSTKLLPPSMLPRVSDNEINFSSLTPDDFSIPSTFDLHIDSSDNLNKLTNQPHYLNNILDKKKTIKLDIQKKFIF